MASWGGGGPKIKPQKPSCQVCSYHTDFIVQVLKTKGLHLLPLRRSHAFMPCNSSVVFWDSSLGKLPSDLWDLLDIYGMRMMKLTYPLKVDVWKDDPASFLGPQFGPIFRGEICC